MSLALYLVSELTTSFNLLIYTKTSFDKLQKRICYRSQVGSYFENDCEHKNIAEQDLPLHVVVVATVFNKYCTQFCLGPRLSG